MEAKGESQCLKAALSYLSMGLSVIPLKPLSKEPLLNWKEFQSRRASESEVKDWFNKCTSANVGIVTGSVSGIAVVDLDGPEGLNSGRSLGLKSSVVSLTGNGRQLWYKNDVTLKNYVKLLPGIDVRAEGGYVVAPPSRHPNGRSYRWLNPLKSLATLEPFPSGVLIPTVSSVDAGLVSTTGNEKGWISEALNGLKIGNIDDTLFKVCSRLRNDGYTEADAITLLQPHAEQAGATPGHLADKVRNVWGRYGPNERGRSQTSYGGTVSNSALVLYSPNNPDSLNEYRKRIDVSSDASLSTGYDNFDALTKGLKKGEVLTVAARTGVGKTNWVITPIRTFCAAGKKVLLFSTEMSFDQIWQRYTAALSRPEEFGSHPFFICDEFTPDIERIEEAIKNVQPDLFIFDHISHIGTDYHVISKFMSEIKRVSRLYDVPAIVTAQLNRNADYVDQGQRVEPRLSMIQGSDQIGQMSAQVLLLNEKRITDGNTEIEGIVVKNRHGDRGMVQFVLKKDPYYRMEEAIL